MLAILSPAKSLDFSCKTHGKSSSPLFQTEAETLIATLRKLSPSKIASLMDISKSLAELNHARFQEWSKEPNPEHTRQALFVFSGEVYRGLNAESLNAKSIAFANDHLRILSGLYGVLRPLDAIQPYRLEMGTALSTKRGKNLYQFWDKKITEALNQETTSTLINLASTEYFKAIKPATLDAKILTPIFKDKTKSGYKVLMTYAKNARGKMARFFIENALKKPAQLKEFSEDGYVFSPKESNEYEWVFLRG